MPPVELSTFIALLRGINVGGGNRLPMADLRALCADLGWFEVQTYVASGNVVFRASGSGGELEEALERAITDRFGLSIVTIVRTAPTWATYVASNPFPEASEAQPSRLMLALSKYQPKEDAVPVLQARAVDGERVARAGDALWIHYAGGAARSKISPGLIDRSAGSPVTTRNWRTVLRLHAMAQTYQS
jgi:uncharacterized protein (DUF1697 family)